MIHSLSSLLNPKSIAVIGASREPNKLGYQILKNIIDGGYGGRIYPVNPNAHKILGKHCYPSILDTIKTRNYTHSLEPVDVAVIVTPAQTVPSIIGECHQAGVKHAIVISAGFAETGNHKLQTELEAVIANSKNLRILGPNCLGILSTHHQLNASFGPPLPKKGEIMLVSQSGALVTGALDWLKQKEAGLSHAISLGNRVDLSEVDCLEYALHDKHTQFILVYLESMAEAQQFFSTASKITPHKPIILLKGGRSPEGAKASASHTAALASDQVLLQAFCRQTGVILTDSVDDWLETAWFMSQIKSLPKDRVSIITNAGGPGVLAVDQIQSHGLKLANLTEKTKLVLANTLPKINNQNPLDILGDAKPDDFIDTIQIVADDTNTDSILVIITPQTTTHPEKIANQIISLYPQLKKPLVVVLLGGEQMNEAIAALQKSQIPVTTYPASAIKLLSRTAAYNIRKSNIYQFPASTPQSFNNLVDLKTPVTITAALNLLENSGIRLPRWELIKHKSEIPGAINKVGRPAVMKTTAMHLNHKAIHGGVALGIMTHHEARMAFRKISRLSPTVLVQQTIHGQLEIILGAKRDPVFGAFITVGIGGSLTNTLDDRAYLFLPSTKTDIKHLLDRTKAGIALQQLKLPIDEVVESLNNLSRIMHFYPQVQEIEINPLIITSNGHAYACDIKLKL